MKFSELPGYLLHELKHGRFDNMISAIEPFIKFSCDEGKSEIIFLLKKVSSTCKEPPDDINKIEREISVLSVTISKFNLGNIRPEYIYKRVDVFTLKYIGDCNCLAIMMKESIIRKTLLKILKMRYNMARNYMKDFHIKDIQGNGFIVLADYDNYICLIENNVSAGQIIYIDFRIVKDDTLRKNLRLPMNLKELDDALSGFK